MHGWELIEFPDFHAMDWMAVLIGLVVGCIIGYLFVTATVKSKMIERTKHDALHSQWQETTTQAKLSEEKPVGRRSSTR